MGLPSHLTKAQASLIIDDGSRVRGAFSVILVVKRYALAAIAITTIITIIIIALVELIDYGRHHH